MQPLVFYGIAPLTIPVAIAYTCACLLIDRETIINNRDTKTKRSERTVPMSADDFVAERSLNEHFQQSNKGNNMATANKMTAAIVSPTSSWFKTWRHPHPFRLAGPPPVLMTPASRKFAVAVADTNEDINAAADDDLRQSNSGDKLRRLRTDGSDATSTLDYRNNACCSQLGTVIKGDDRLQRRADDGWCFWREK